MRIKPSDRVIFENNPLAEVVCQVRFDSRPLNEDLTQALASEINRLGYPILFVEEVNTVTLQVVPEGLGNDFHQTTPAPIRIYHFTTQTGEWRASYSVDFVAITCTKYTEWKHFKPRLIDLINLFIDKIGNLTATRIGLRYRDIIDREKLGLTSSGWPELLQPFVLGPFAAVNLCEGAIPEEDVLSFFFQSNLQLNDCKVLFQGGLARSTESQNTAFVIDADFYLDSEECQDCLKRHNLIEGALERLHSNAGNLFSRTIQEKLHDALSPRPSA